MQYRWTVETKNALLTAQRIREAAELADCPEVVRAAGAAQVCLEDLERELARMEIYPEDLELEGLAGAAARLIHAIRTTGPDYSLAKELKALELKLEEDLPQVMRGHPSPYGGDLYQFGKDSSGRVWCVVGFAWEGPEAAPDYVMVRDAMTGEDKDISVAEYRAMTYISDGNTPPPRAKDGDRVMNEAGKMGKLEKQGRGKSIRWRIHWEAGGPTPYWQERILER